MFEPQKNRNFSGHDQIDFERAEDARAQEDVAWQLNYAEPVEPAKLA